MVSVRLGVSAILLVVLAAGPASAQSGEAADAVADAIVALRTEALLLVELDGLATIPPSLAAIHQDWVGFTNGSTRAELLLWLYDVDETGAAVLSRITASGARPSPAVTLALGELPSLDRLSLESLGTIEISSDHYVAAIDGLAARLGPAFSVPDAPIGGAALEEGDASVPSGTDQLRRGVVGNAAVTTPYPWAAVSSALLAVLMAGMLMILVGRRSTRPRVEGGPDPAQTAEIDTGEPVPIP